MAGAIARALLAKQELVDHTSVEALGAARPRGRRAQPRA
jgi:hypothetical protein